MKLARLLLLVGMAGGASIAHSAVYPLDGNRAAIPEIRIERHGANLKVHADAVVKASRETAWSVLTDYDHLASFVPDMTESRIVSRTGNVVRVRQAGHTGPRPVRRDFMLTIEASESPMTRIDMKMVEGTFSRFEAAYEITDGPQRGTLHIDYRSEFDPQMPVPDWLGLGYVKGTIQEQFAAVMHEIERRAGPTR
ncbi:hypothetical protein BH10PSE17_BH10PSE17_08360 [soil metagenome]